MTKVAIVGKPNVGKSTFFNRIIQKRQAIVDDKPGVTRDRLYGQAEWLNQPFVLIDTGGLTNSEFDFKKNIQLQVEYAINESDIILFMVSKKEGINNDDFYVAKILKKHKNKKIILVVNKSENQSNDDYNQQYHALSFSKPYFISSSHGIGVGDLLDEIVKFVKKHPSKNLDTYKIAIIGKPNVGKSSLVNAILRQERVIVSNIPNTTRDSIDCDFQYDGKQYTIIDTAGIRRKGKIVDQVEKYAVLRSQAAIERANLILLMLDGSEKFKEQDEVIAGLSFASNIPTIIVVNKWDLVPKTTLTMNEFIKNIRQQFQFLTWAPIVFISAKENKRIHDIFQKIGEINQQLKIKVSTSVLNDVISKAVILNPPPKFKGNRITINYATQVASQIPTFVIFTNDPKYLHFSYSRYLENKIREAFGINLVPITLYFKDKNSRIRLKHKKV